MATIVPDKKLDSQGSILHMDVYEAVIQRPRNHKTDNAALMSKLCRDEIVA